ncbi:MAG: DUF1643 domain-containing protein [Vulcanimicrobiaceae bacterium]
MTACCADRLHDNDGACFSSEDAAHRFLLWRRVNGFFVESPPEKQVTFVLLNPSTANATAADPTMRRCMGFAAALGATRLEIVNLFSFVSSDPRDLASAAAHAPAHRERNVAHMIASARRASVVIVGYGAGAARPSLRGGVTAMQAALEPLGIPVHTLKVTKDGTPSHPLYLRADARPMPYAWPSRQGARA